jgi:hypothetical protein
MADLGDVAQSQAVVPRIGAVLVRVAGDATNCVNRMPLQFRPES